MRAVCLTALIALLAACTDKQAGSSGYFDSRLFFEQQVIKLKDAGYLLKKELRFGDKEESMINDPVNWQQELTPFLSIDLNKPSYNRRFRVDTNIFYPGFFKVTYLPVDRGSDLQRIELIYASDQITKAGFLYTKENSLYRSKTMLEFYTDSAYSIEGTQTVKSGREIRYKIAATFLKP